MVAWPLLTNACCALSSAPAASSGWQDRANNAEWLALPRAGAN